MRIRNPPTGGGGASPENTVQAETTFGIASNAGVLSTYQRGDHTHGSPTDPVPAHVAAADPHTVYQRESEKDAASGYAGLDGAANVNAGEVATASIEDAAVVYAKVQDISAASRLLGRGSAAGAGDVEEITLGTNLSMAGTVLNAAGGGGGSHDLLSATHPDTTPAAVSRGSLVTGQAATPTWAELVLGAAATLLQSDGTDILWQAFLELLEIAAPTAPGADKLRTYAFNNGAGAQLRTRDEFGLIDILSQRDRQRSRKNFYIGQGSDAGTGATDHISIGIQIVSAEGTVSNVVGDADGQRKNFATVATIDTDAGPPGPFTQARRDFNPDVTIKFRVPTTVTRRVWLGFVESDHMALDTSAAIHKFALRLSTSAASTAFTLAHSDGTTETLVNLGVSDTAIHTIRLIADNANARWGYSFDGAAVTWVTTNIPAATALVGLQLQIRTLAAAIANMEFWYADGSMEK